MIVTTKEQSERLLKAGLSPDTADFVYREILGGTVIQYNENRLKSDTPAWSMGQLWDILYKLRVSYYDYGTDDSVEKVMESLVWAVERCARQKKV